MRSIDTSHKLALSHMGTLTLPQLQALLGQAMPAVRPCHSLALMIKTPPHSSRCGCAVVSPAQQPGFARLVCACRATLPTASRLAGQVDVGDRPCHSCRLCPSTS